MSVQDLRAHRQQLEDFASSAERAARELPDDWLAALAAQNQRANADDAGRMLAIAEAEALGELVELHLSGPRLRHGFLPLEFLARVAQPLNNLFVKSAYFVKTKADAVYGAADDVSREMGLALVGVGAGSTRLMIAGQSTPDTTGFSAFEEGKSGLFSVLDNSGDFRSFFEHLDDIGERGAEALHSLLKAVEGEECALEMVWHRPVDPRHFIAPFERIVQLRALLDGIGDQVERSGELEGLVCLLSANGRIQLELADGRKASIRFRPKTQAAMVARLTLNSAVHVTVQTKVTRDPITGDDIERHALSSIDRITPAPDGLAG